MFDERKKYIDPLFQMFEHYLFHRSYDDLSGFTKDVAEEYLTYLDSSRAHVPFHLRSSVVKDLESEAHEMLVKKMYGCVRSDDYLNFGRVMHFQKEELVSLDFQSRIQSNQDEEELKKG